MDEEASDEKEKQIPEEFRQSLESETGWVDLEGVAAVLGMAATTFHGNSVGIGEVAKFTPREKCKLHTHVCSLIVIGLFMDTSHWCCKDGSFGRA